MLPGGQTPGADALNQHGGAHGEQDARRYRQRQHRLARRAPGQRRDAELRAEVERVQQDHGWLEEDWIELAPQLQAVAQDYSWYEINELSHAVSVFVNLYHEHISLEEWLIYPASRKREAVASAGTQARHNP